MSAAAKKGYYSAYQAAAQPAAASSREWTAPQATAEIKSFPPVKRGAGCNLDSLEMVDPNFKENLPLYESLIRLADQSGEGRLTLAALDAYAANVEKLAEMYPAEWLTVIQHLQANFSLISKMNGYKRVKSVATVERYDLYLLALNLSKKAEA